MARFLHDTLPLAEPETSGSGTLDHIYRAAGFIRTDTAGLTFDTFMADRRTRQVVERNFVIAGEAVGCLRRHAPEVAVHLRAGDEMVGFSNQLSFDYDQVDYLALWRAVQETLPGLLADVDTLLREAEAR
jgi:uncharacterized protein with HEPN domain